MSARLLGIVIGVLVAGFYALQLQRLRTGRAGGAGVANPAAQVIAIVGLLIGVGVAVWWLLS